MVGNTRKKGSGSQSRGSDRRTENENATTNEKPHLSNTPGGVWFDDRRVVNLLSESFTANYIEYMTNLSSIKKDHRIHMCNYFKARVTYDNEMDVEKEYYKLIKNRILDIIYRIKEEEVQPEWMPDDCFEQLLNRKNDAKWAEKSGKAKANRMTGAIDGKARPTSTLGRRSAIRAFNFLTCNKDQPDPTPIKMLELSKKNKEDKWISSKAEQISANYDARLQSLREAGQTEVNEYEAYLETVQRDKKGRVFGTGSATQLFFKAPPKHSTQGADSSTYVPGVVAQYATQNAMLTQTVAKLTASQEYEKRRNDAMAAMMKEKFGWSFPEENCNPGSSATRRDDHFDDDSSGGTFGNDASIPTM